MDHSVTLFLYVVVWLTTCSSMIPHTIVPTMKSWQRDRGVVHRRKCRLTCEVTGGQMEEEGRGFASQADINSDILNRVRKVHTLTDFSCCTPTSHFIQHTTFPRGQRHSEWWICWQVALVFLRLYCYSGQNLPHIPPDYHTGWAPRIVSWS